MLSFFRQLAERTDSSSSSTLRSRFWLNGSSRHLPPRDLGPRLLEIDEELQLVLQDARAKATASSGVTAPLVSTVSGQLVIVQ